MRLSLPNNADGLSQDLLAVLQRRRIEPPEGITALTEVLVVAITMLPKQVRLDAVKRVNETIRDNILLVGRHGL